ncbi:unnamed protein product [Clonostachys byssicola]|uniref:SCP domain-containing protein n=1 Tax=Clonostachys byssicola TaxID=160290 RepID=A0A9N9ULW9_9HYPO|nr:unnamed protein product [Clonostachys byssicola]
MFFSNVLIQTLLLSGAGYFACANPITRENGGQVGTSVGHDVNTSGFPGTIPDPEFKVTTKNAVANPAAASLTSDETEALRLHNAARAGKGLPPLVWDAKLAANAAAWAQSLKNSNSFQHSSAASRPNQGENLAQNSSPSKPIDNPLALGTQQWLNEAKDYSGQAIPGTDFSSYGHYTQIMWKTTTSVGIASATNGKGTYWTVARYSPPGNMVGQKPY